MAGALDLLEAGHVEREAHQHLLRECSWYRHVENGGRDHPDMHCRPATGEPRGLHEGGALVKFATGPYVGDADDEQALEDFRRVVFTSPRTQMTVMTLKPGESIGSEVHKDGDQLFMLLSGTGVVTLNGKREPLHPHSIFAVPQGTRHNVTNTGTEPLKLVTVYAPPQHPAGTVEPVKLTARTLEEANYRATGSDMRNCRTCEYSTGWKGSQGRCTMFAAPVSRGHVCDEWDAEGKAELTPRTPEASTVVKPTVPPGGPGLFHMKGHHLPPYIEHLYPHLVARYGKHAAYGVAVGIVKKWAQGVNPGGWDTKSGKGKRTHPDVRAAAAANVAEWEKERATAHERHGHSAAEPGIALAVATAPGARPFLLPPTPGASYSQYGLYQHPSLPIVPSPPRPPDVALPTPAEVRAVIPLVPDCSKPDLSATARKFLEQAAGKLEKDAVLEALAVMRSAETALYAAHKADKTELIPVAYNANVFAAVPPAAQSSATSAMKQGNAKMLAWRKAEMALGALADRIRKKFFHGVYNGPSQMARLTEDRTMTTTALDRVLALAGASITTGKDVSEPTESDTSGATPLIQPSESLLSITDADAARELAALPDADRARVTAYLDKARAQAGTNRFGASQSAIRAAMVARDAGAHDLCRHIWAHVRALAEAGNLTNPADTAARMQAAGRTVSPRNSPQTVADTGNNAATLSAVDALIAAAASR